MPRLTLSRLAVAVAAGVLGLPAAAHAADVNHDRIPDRWERTHHLSLRVDQQARDQDHDGLKNLAEYRDHTDPRRADTNGDGVRDGQEDADGDGRSNLAEQRRPDAGAAPAGSGDGGGESARYDHVGSYTQGTGYGGVLVLARADGSSVSAFLGERSLLLCGAVAAGPFSPCPLSVLVAGAAVAGAEHGTNDGGVDVWKTVRLLVPPATPVAPAEPAPVAAPAPGGTIASFTGGVLSIDRPNGFEHPAGTLADGAAITCVHVHAGLVTASAPCGPDALVAGRPVGLTQGALVDGARRWTRVDVLIVE